MIFSDWILCHNLVLFQYFLPVFFSTSDCNISGVNIACWWIYDRLMDIWASCVFWIPQKCKYSTTVLFYFMGERFVLHRWKSPPPFISGNTNSNSGIRLTVTSGGHLLSPKFWSRPNFMARSGCSWACLAVQQVSPRTEIPQALWHLCQCPPTSLMTIIFLAFC